MKNENIMKNYTHEYFIARKRRRETQFFPHNSPKLFPQLRPKCNSSRVISVINVGAVRGGRFKVIALATLAAAWVLNKSNSFLIINEGYKLL